MDKKILNHFKKHDSVLYRWALKFKKEIADLKKARPNEYFLNLCDAITGQQLSGKAASAIFRRFKKLFFGLKPTPQKVLALNHKKLRSVGLSNAKAMYLKYLAKAVVTRKLPLSKFDQMCDGDVKQSLLAVKGIGPWTAEMFLMFTLARPDIFSFGDLGLRKGILKVYRLKTLPKKDKLEKIVARWSPYKSYASKILWAAIEENWGR